MLPNCRRRIMCLMLVVFGVLLVAGCTSSGRTYTNTQMHETLEVEILNNNSKMFVYRLKWPEDAIPNHIQIARNGPNPRSPREQSGIEINRRTHDRLLANATYAVGVTAYCRNGFFELDHSLSRYHLWLKGECKESATDADKTKFGEEKVLELGKQST